MNKYIDTALTALAPVIWGTTYYVTTELLPPDRPFTAAALRALPAGILLVLHARRLLRGDQWWKVGILAVLNIGLFQALLFTAAYRLPGGLAAVLGAIQPMIIMGLAWAVDSKRPRWAAIAAAVTGVGGMAAMLLSPGARWDAVGVAAALAGAASMALGTWLTRRWQGGMRVLDMTGWQLLIGGVLLAPLALLADPPLASLAFNEAAGYAYLSLAGALLAYVLWFRGVVKLPTVAVSALGLLSPVTAVLVGWALLHQSISGTSLAGLAIVLASVMALQFVQQPAKAGHA